MTKPIVLTSTKDLSHEEWLAFRRQGIGGSDVSAILGLNPYRSAFDVYADKLGLVPPPDENEAMWLGTELEPIVAKRFSNETGLQVQRRNQMLQHPDHRFMLANIDRWVVGKKAGLEIKTTNLLNRTDFTNGEIPPNYYCQALHYMAVTGADEWYVAIAVLGRGFHILNIPRNQPEIDALIAAEKQFWENHVLSQVPPSPDGSESAGSVIRELFKKERGDGVVVPLFGDEDKLVKIQDLDRQIRQLEKESDALKQQIQLEIGDHDGGKANGFQVWWRSQNRSSIDSKRLQREKPDVYQEYSRITSFRKFEIKKFEKGA